MAPSAVDRIVLFTEGRDWHAERLIAAFSALGQPVLPSRLSKASPQTGGGRPVAIEGLGEGLPRAALVRGIAAGTFQSITLRLTALHLLEAAGVLLVNRATAIERCVDKAATSVLVERAGLPTPRTLVTACRDQAQAFLREEFSAGHQVVAKPLFGAQGKGLVRLRSMRDMPHADDVDDVWYLQRFVPPRDGRYRDHRLLVSGGRVVSAMTRIGRDWITNVHQGATPVALTPTPRQVEVALAAAAATGAALAGVDLIDGEDGTPLVLEVNATPAWAGLQAVTGFDIAAVIAGDLIAAAGT